MKTSFYIYQIKYDMIRKKKTKGEENQYVLFTPTINWSLQKSVSSAKQEMIKHQNYTPIYIFNCVSKP